MICAEDKEEAMELIKEATESGARRAEVCELLGLSIRTLQRWEKHGRVCDNRKGSHPNPVNKLSDEERQEIIKLSESAEFKDLSPNQIVPKLADQEVYIASESTFHRVLKENNMNKHRQASKPASNKAPATYIATAPNQVWSWDITYLPAMIKGTFFYLYMVMDIFSRKIVSFQVYSCESGEYAADLIADGYAREKIQQNQLVLHSDNGSPMRSLTMLAKLQNLGVIPSFSRPSVSNDNPYSESLFKTFKYRPHYPEKHFKSLSHARTWSEDFVNWYNNSHLHSGISFVAPASRHDGDDIEILQKRHKLYLEAKAKHPERWSGNTRNWDRIKEVALNKRNIIPKVDLALKSAA